MNGYSLRNIGRYPFGFHVIIGGVYACFMPIFMGIPPCQYTGFSGDTPLVISGLYMGYPLCLYLAIGGPMLSVHNFYALFINNLLSVFAISIALSALTAVAALPYIPWNILPVLLLVKSLDSYSDIK